MVEAVNNLSHLSALCEEWEQSDEQVQAHKTYRQLLLSLIRLRLNETGKLSWTNGVWKVAARPRYMFACAECRIAVEECVHSNGAHLEGDAIEVRLVKIALPDAQRWISVERVEKPKPQRPRLRVLEFRQKDEDASD